MSENDKMQQMQQQMNPEMTLDVSTEAVEEKIRQYNEKKTQENLSRLIGAIRKARLLVPASVHPESKQPVPCLLQRPDGEAFFPVYTSKMHIPKEPRSEAVINMSYRMANQLVAKEAVKTEGIVINPFTDQLVFRKPLVLQIEDMGESEVSDEPKTLQLSEKDYVRYERKQFEYGFLPRKLFEDGQELVQRLSEEKEAYLDELFEESYQQKRLYPYLTEEFSVMVMNISDTLRVIRMDLPTRDMAVPSCYRIFLAWDSKAGVGRYFMVEKATETGAYLGEIVKDWKHIEYGQAPAEGAELNKILSIIQGENAS